MRNFMISMIFLIFFTITYFINIGLWLIAGILVYYFYFIFPSTDRIDFQASVDEYNRRNKGD